MILKFKKTRELITQRVGFHYFPDTAHYTNKDLSNWLPVLKQLKAGWLVLVSDSARAIPEQFISGLLAAGITPLIHIPLPLPNSPSANDMKAIITAYSRWGVKYIIFFDRPNEMSSWSAAGWVQQNLVERFIDRFLPLAAAAAQVGMTPIFPPLQPGGSYWDLTFLKQALQSMSRRGYTGLIQQMGLASYAYTNNHELEYGAGGPEKWPNTLPYTQNPGSEDQNGFRNHEWLQSVTRSVCNLELPVFMLGAGMKEAGVPYSPEMHAGVCLNILERLKGLAPANAIPDYVKSCSFYLLGAEPESEAYASAWFKSRDEYLPIVDFLLPGTVDEEKMDSGPDLIATADADTAHATSFSGTSENSHPLEHYLLLPVYEWGIADFHLDVTRPFVLKHHPTVGFSIKEAALASRVTVIGGEQTFPEEVLDSLRESGSIVDRISGDGTSIATQLAER